MSAGWDTGSGHIPPRRTGTSPANFPHGPHLRGHKHLRGGGKQININKVFLSLGDFPHCGAAMEERYTVCYDRGKKAMFLNVIVICGQVGFICLQALY